MKPSSFIFFLIPFLMGFSADYSNQEYTYLLKMTSTDDIEHYFNLEITSSAINQAEKNTITVKKLRTPYERKLESGKHRIVVNHLGEKGFIVSKVTGIRNGQIMGSAAADFGSTLLTAGSGNYSAGPVPGSH